MDTSEPLRWLLGRGIALLVGTVVLLVVYRVGVTAIHRVVPAVIHAQATHLRRDRARTMRPASGSRRSRTFSSGSSRVGVLAGLVVMVLAVFGWWNLLGGIVLLIAAIMFATRDVVLDYVMGFLLLVEGPFFQGDYVVVDGHPGVEGVVAEIGLRRTLLRDGMGSSHAVSNGLIRLSSNRTRLFSVAVVDFTVPRAVDLDPALALAARVGDEIRRDPAWADTFLADAPTEISVTGIGLDGPSIRLQQQVPTGAQGRVASELRRRMIAAMAAESIGTGGWTRPRRSRASPRPSGTAGRRPGDHGRPPARRSRSTAGPPITVDRRPGDHGRPQARRVGTALHRVERLGHEDDLARGQDRAALRELHGRIEARRP